jgi:2-dehydropantoate 2-reductase
VATVAVVGVGAIGGYFAAQLAGAGHRVVLCTRTPFDRLSVETEGHVEVVDAPVLTDPALCPPADWVLLATKAHQTAATAPWLAAACTPATLGVAVLQNGIDQRDRVAPFVGSTPVLPVIVLCGAEPLEPGRIRHHGSSHLEVPAGPLGEKFASLFVSTAASVGLSADFDRSCWLKLLQNITASPIMALTGCRMGVMGRPEIAELARGLALEAVAVGQAAGVELSKADADALVAGFGRINPEMGSSMLYDRQAGRPLEHLALTGTVVRLGQTHGIPVPLNGAIEALLGALDPPY